MPAAGSPKPMASKKRLDSLGDPDAGAQADEGGEDADH
jgi:hypothetical protein